MRHRNFELDESRETLSMNGVIVMTDVKIILPIDLKGVALAEGTLSGMRFALSVTGKGTFDAYRNLCREYEQAMGLRSRTSKKPTA